MRKVVIRMHHFLWLLAIVIICIGITKKGEVIDINVHDTYFVIAKSELYTIIAAYFGSIGLVYWLFSYFKRETNKALNFLYITLMLMGITSLTIIPLFYTKNIYYTNTNGVVYESGAILILVAQLILVINFAATFLKKELIHKQLL